MSPEDIKQKGLSPIEYAAGHLNLSVGLDSSTVKLKFRLKEAGFTEGV